MGRTDAPGPPAGPSARQARQAMRAPPPVEFESTLGRAGHAALSLLVGASVAVPIAWALPWLAVHRGRARPDALIEALGDPLGQGALALCVAALAVAAFRRSTHRAACRGRTLRWDGREWLLSGDATGRPAQRGDAALMIDLGPWMLVRFVSTSGPGPTTSWLPLTAAGDPARWAALRGALWNARPGRGEAR